MKNAIKVITQFCIYFILICIGFVYLQPIFMMISKAFMSASDVIDPSVEWIPRDFSFDNLKIAADVLNLGETFKNTVLFAGGLATCQTVISAITGFALSRYSFKFKKMWFVLIIVGFIIPIPVLMVPRLMMVVWFQEAIDFVLIGTIIPQVAMAIMGQGIYSTVLILIFYNFFNLIPKSLDEAAMIDGASSLQVFYYVVVRLSLSTILVVFLFSLVWNWNETYITGTLVRGGIDLIPSKLALFDSEFEGAVVAAGSAFKLNEAYKMSATLISITPLIVLYAFVQRKFIQGIENTGITGE
ncbi:ABC transporter permease [Candidatus Epulonipiscium fishelsonii]|uniref:ABC transporter permease n=1 Tax=Candidatus Epulonipiscium fishelsonii TaxID=77094 RepID=A0ACC8XBB7_9FIRM|nr:ABC transporter permease [Epulopiscium sp. SCG-B05WGA-EpuloA1]ONI39708.1 ABC transporter permease [Epulopiscium sp. SCG-B11WGA-EpuloA1]